MIETQKLKDGERLVRLTMIVILLTAGISKLFSGGGFYDYYSGLFQGDLRIILPTWIVNLYLSLIPFIEIILGLLLITPNLKRWTTYAWFAFMLSLMVGHYVLQEWSAVNQMLDYFFLGFLCFLLPNHTHIYKRDAEPSPDNP